MPKLIDLETYSDKRGSLSVLQDHQIPFPIKRMFYIYNVDESNRGGHRHHKTVQALICISGSCLVYSNDGKEETEYLLDDPKKCLIVYPEDWHVMKEFVPNTTLLVMASEYYDPEDYIFENYS